MIKTLLASILISLLQAATGNTTLDMHVGTKNGYNEGNKIFVFYDTLLEPSIVSSRDFNCTDVNGCTYDPIPKTMTYMGKTITYYDGLTQFNVIKQPFTQRMKFRYLLNDPQNVGSIIGCYTNSTFFNYLYEQDKVADYRIILRLDWNNTLTYKTGIYETDKVNVYHSFSSNVTRYNNNASSTKVLNVCLTNRVDKKSISQSYMAVREEQFIDWVNYISSGNSNDTVVIDLYTPKGFNIGTTSFAKSELRKSDGGVLIKSFSSDFDEGRGCDIYTGNLFLKKYDYKFYYIEYDAGYDLKFGLDIFQGPEPVETPNKSGFIWKLIVFIVIVTIAGVVFYKYVYKRPGNEVRGEAYQRIDATELQPAPHA